jgi:subtilisin family serine protease
LLTNQTVICTTATTIGGALYGVAKDVTIVAVKVLNSAGSGSYSGVIAGINYVTAQKRASPNTDMVANLSIGGGFSAVVNDAINATVAEGIVVAVAAGNSNANACNYSPAFAASAITVGARFLIFLCSVSKSLTTTITISTITLLLGFGFGSVR